ncbi:hypothetical protein [Ensifer sp. NM-2]|uniref:hypothetical protein n=1 Tax=Ensifer sp. NM-2 TaxID=2109730 RepID=UPI000D134BE7|nr:hypothetical protein [Ensifer sp. NM-2]
MPIVFVHGVNNRRDDGYRENEAARNGFLRDIVAESLNLPPDSLTIKNPYWGGDAVKFAWNMAVLPDSNEKFESFGTDPEVDAQNWTIDLVSADPNNGGLVERARKNLVGAVDLLFGATLAGAKDEDEAREIAQSYRLALAYAERHPHPDWLDDPSLNDDNFADVLAAKIEDDEEESFGSGGFLDRLKEGASRIKNAIPNAGSNIFVNVAREKLNATISRFAGDAFVYLKERGTVAVPGTIVKIVLDDLKAATAAKTDGDSKLVVIAHSFGGEIMYDILTHFAPDLKVDVLVTVGSQVGLFEEMKLYIASGKVKVPEKVAKPANVAHWLNVFDINDVLSFRVAPVFSDTSDFEYNTGYSSLQAHGGYFLRPSFYVRLAARLKELVGDN